MMVVCLVDQAFPYVLKDKEVAKVEVVQDSPAKVEDSSAEEEVAQNSPVKFEALKDFPDSLDAVIESGDSEEAADEREEDKEEDEEENDAEQAEDSEEAFDEDQGWEEAVNSLQNRLGDPEQAEDSEEAADEAKDVSAKIEVLKDFPASLNDAEDATTTKAPYKIEPGWNKCATGQFLTERECRRAGFVLPYTYSGKISMSTRNYGCIKVNKNIYFNSKKRGTPSRNVRSICKRRY